MCKGVGCCPVRCQLAAYANATDHVADLADDMVGQQPPRIVFQHGVDHAVDRHGRSQPYE